MHNINKNNEGSLQKIFRFFEIKSLSIYRFVIFILFFISLVSIVIISGIWGISESRRINNKIKEQKEISIIQQKARLKEEVNSLKSYIEFKKTDIRSGTLEKTQDEVLNYFQTIRFGNDGYVFINTYDGKALLFDGQKLETPIDITDLQDPNGLRIFDKEMELAKLPNGGYFNYLFKKIYSKQALPKLSYVIGFDEWGWIIGTGDYFDNIELEITRLKNELKSVLYKKLFLVLGVFTIDFLLLILLSIGIAKGVKNQFTKFVSILKQDHKNSDKAKVFNQIFIKELKTIGLEILQTKTYLSQSQKNYAYLFENAPVSLWEEDFSDVIAYLEAELKQMKLSLEELFNQYPNTLLKCASLVKVVNVNKQTLELFEASHKEELFGNISKLFTENSIPVFKQSLLALYRGDEVFATQAENISLKGRRLDLALRWTFVSEQKKGVASKVILSMTDFTDLRKNEAALIESEHRFHSIFQNSHTIMFLISPENGKIINTNPAAVNFYGYSKEKFENELSIYDLNTLKKEEVLKLVRSAQKEKNAFYNFQHRLAKGEIRDVEVYSGLIELKQKAVLFSIVHDVTDKRQAEKLVIESKNKLESIFRVAPAGIGVLSNRVFSEINDRFCEIVGYNKEELLGKESVMIYPSKEEFDQVGKEKYRQIREKGTGSVETRFKRKDGEIVHVILSSTPLDSNNLSLGVTFTALDITERKKATLELKQTHDRLSDTLERMSDGFISLNKDWIYTYVNHKAAEIFGRKPEDLLGKHIWTEFPEGIDQPFYNTYYKVVETQEIITFEDYYSPWDRWFKNMVIPTQDGLAIFFQDITFRKKASLALKQSNDYIQTIFDSTTDAIFIHDGKTGEILDVNKQMCSMYGYTKEEVMQLEFNDLGTGKHPFSMEDAKNLMQKSFDEGPQTADWIVRHKDGHFFWTEVSIQYVEIAGEGRFIASVRNIEERKKSEKELEKYRLHLEELVKERTGQLEQSQGALLNLVDDLNKQSLKLEESNASLNAINRELETFTYSVSHDLKAPLRGIDGYSRLLLDAYFDDLNPEARQFLDNIRSSAKQMNLLIEDLLAYSRMERKEIISESLELKNFMNTLLPYYAANLEQDKIEIELDIPNDFYIKADRDSLNIVFRNLMDNAIKFRTKTKQAKIEIKASENNENWLIFVKDNGIGFEMKYQERIFKIFQRLHLAEEYEGTGIGLAMVAKAMNRMNGKVWAESEIGKGSCFYLEIGK